MLTADVLAEVASATWSDASPTASVVVATHDRAGFLPELFAALEESQVREIELIIVDDGSTDRTWEVLEAQLAGTTLPALALRVAATGGPSLPRNTGAVRARGQVLLLTDDDCLPQPGWAAVLGAAGAHTVAQGRTEPLPGGPVGPWDRSISVSGLTGLFETCNLGLPRSLFLELGGFPVLDVGDRGMGEDLVLGHRAAAIAGARYVEQALVQHRWIPTTFAGHLRGRRRLSAFPALVKQSPGLRRHLLLGTFLSSRTAAVDAAAAGLALLVTGRRSGLLAMVPWALLALRDARGRPGRSLAVRAGQVAVADTVAAASLVAGSLRQRTPVL